MAGYWEAVSQHRLNRRRLIGATAATTAAAAFLAACGGGNDSSEGSKDKSGLLVKPVDQTKQAKRGGTLQRSASSEPAGLDPHGGGATVATYYEIAQAILMLMTNAYATGKMVYGDKGGRYVSPCPSNPTDDCRSDVIPTGAGNAHLSAVSAPEVTSHGPGT